jgi:hypothetical protein
MLGDALQAWYATLMRLQRRGIDLTVADRTLEEMSSELDCSASLVSREEKAIHKRIASG